MRRLLLVLLSLLALAGLASGCGSSSSAGSGADDPAKALPASTLLFASVQVRPSGDVKSGVEAAGRKILAGKELGPELQKLFDKSTKGDKVTYKDDIEPWLGQRIAVGVTGYGSAKPDVVVLANATDEGKAKDALAKAPHPGQQKSYKGVDYRSSTGMAAGVTDGFFIVGTTEAAFRASVDSLKGGPSLADSATYKDATSKVTSDGLGLLFVDTRRFVDVIAQSSPQGSQALSQLRTLPQFRDLKPTAAALTADGDAIRLEAPATAANTDTSAADAVAKLPANSWLALAAPRAGRQIRTQLNTLSGAQGQQFAQLKRLLREQTGLDLDRDVLSWIQGFSLFATGTTLPDLKVGLVIDSSDPAASRRALAKIAGLLARQGKGTRVRRTADGFEIQPPRAPAPVSFSVTGNRVLIAYGTNVRAALSGSSTLAGSGTYSEAKKALGGGKPAFLVSLPTILQFAQNLGAANSPGYAKAAPYLKAFGAITSGMVDSGGKRVSRFVVGLR